MSSRRRVWVRATCFALTVVFSMVPSALARDWVLQPVPPSALPAGALSAVSCASVTNCVAIGSRYGDPLVEQWNGSHWLVADDPISQKPSAVLGGVGCDARVCTVVAASTGLFGGGQPISESWDGRRWTVAKMRDLHNGDDNVGLSSVSCPSDNFCTAVGYDILTPLCSCSQPTFPVLERWDGRTWGFPRVRWPGNWSDLSLAQVSCASRTDCVGVGSFDVGDGCGYDGPCTTYPLLEVWNGKAWSPSRVPGAERSKNVELDGVSCPRLDHCIVTGRVEQFGHHRLFEAEESGSSWTIRTLPEPRGAVRSDLTGLACSANSKCVAYGLFTDGARRQRPFLEQLSSARWMVRRVAEPAGSTGTEVIGAACPSMLTCFLVGDFVDAHGRHLTLLERSQAKGLRVQQAPVTVSGGELDGVSCPSVVLCVAVGSTPGTARVDGLPSAGGTLAERWNGSDWSVQDPPVSPSIEDGDSLDSVSCPDTTACIVVGGFGSSPRSTHGLTEHWDGAQWTLAATPQGNVGTMTGVSCASVTACVATDNVRGPFGWDGRSWSDLDPKAGVSGAANGVSCVAANACTLVGDGAENWDGSSLTAENDPTSLVGVNVSLHAVSCTSSSRCIAVGAVDADYDTAAGPVPLRALAEVWDGSAWTEVAVPPPAGATVTVLNGVSCTSDSVCIAVGGYGTDGLSVNLPLIEVWDGAQWSIDTPAVPAGAATSTLNAVSCLATTGCTAVGVSDGNPLAERTQ